MGYFLLQVFEAVKHDIPRATGIEINRVLVYYARLKALVTRQNQICQFKRANLWKVNILRKKNPIYYFFFFSFQHDLSKYDTIVLFGVDTMVRDDFIIIFFCILTLNFLDGTIIEQISSRSYR